MHNSLQPYESLVQQKYLRKQETEDLVQYTYTEAVEHERHWNEYTRSARGIIFNKNTGQVVARPFKKFFNYATTEETFIQNLPQLPYKTYEKVDGSLAIIYWYNNKWNVATKGSFNSEQAVKAQEMLSKYGIELLNPSITYLAEIIYPDNKIVVNYGDKEELVLLSAFWTYSNDEVNRQSLEFTAKDTGMPICKEYNYTIDQMIELQKTIPKDQEGFVVRFSNGFRVKIKGVEYCKIHKIISHLTPLSLWEVMKDGKVDLMYIQQIPEEYIAEFRPIVDTLESQYNQTYTELLEDINRLPSKDDKRAIGMFLKENDIKHSKGIFPYVLGNKEALNKYIMNCIRPRANIFKSID